MAEQYRPESLSFKQQVVDEAYDLIENTFIAISAIPEIMKSPKMILVSDDNQTGWQFDAALDGKQHNEQFQLTVAYLAINKGNKAVVLTKQTVDAEGHNVNGAVALRVTQETKSPHLTTYAGEVSFTDLTRRASEPYYQPEVNTKEAFQKAQEFVRSLQTYSHNHGTNTRYH